MRAPINHPQNRQRGLAVSLLPRRSAHRGKSRQWIRSVPMRVQENIHKVAARLKCGTVREATLSVAHVSVLLVLRAGVQGDKRGLGVGGYELGLTAVAARRKGDSNFA